MNKAFAQLKKACCQIGNSRPNMDEGQVVDTLQRAISAWSEEGEKSRYLFESKPIGSKAVFEIDLGQKTETPVARRLFRLRDSEGRFLLLTGEEFISLAEQFGMYHHANIQIIDEHTL